MDKEFRQILYDRFEGWEIVEFLQIPIEEIVDIFEDRIIENLEDVEDLAGIRKEKSYNDYPTE